MSAFTGVRVLDLGQVYNGPYCGLLLAQLGADVIKVEPPTGEPLRFRSVAEVETHEFVMLNSSKRSIALDLKSERGRQVLLDLVDTADVLIENFAPGTMERLGLPAELLLERNPRLVYATGKGYGLTGPYAGMSAMDITVQAVSGTISSTGQPDGPPTKAGPAFIDFSGGVHLFAGIASALFQRERTGRGQVVEVSMHDTVYPTLASALGGLYSNPASPPPERTGNRHSGLAVTPYNVYRAADGWVAIIAISERHFAGVADAIGRPELTGDPRFADRFARVRNMDELDAEIERWTGCLDRSAVVAALTGRGVPCAPVLTVREVSRDPHLIERGMIRYVQHPRRGEVPVPGCPIRLGDSPMTPLTPASGLGEATDDVLAELCGYDQDLITQLHHTDVVR